MSMCLCTVPGSGQWGINCHCSGEDDGCYLYSWSMTQGMMMKIVLVGFCGKSDEFGGKSS